MDNYFSIRLANKKYLNWRNQSLYLTHIYRLSESLKTTQTK